MRRGASKQTNFFDMRLLSYMPPPTFQHFPRCAIGDKKGRGVTARSNTLRFSMMEQAYTPLVFSSSGGWNVFM